MRIPRIAYTCTFVIFSLLFLPASACAQVERLAYKGSVNTSLDLIEMEREMMMERQLAPAQVQNPPRTVVAPEESMLLATLYLNESFSDIPQPVAIEQGNYIRVVGQGIRRFLVSDTRVCSVEKKGPDELYITGQEIGYTYVHIWDNQGRWGIAFFTTPPKPKGLSVAEEMKQREEAARNFKLQYIMDWDSFLTGSKLDSLQRLSHSFFHSLTLEGPTPYGDLDSNVTVRDFDGETDLAYVTLGLDHGVIGDYKDFSLRVLDFQSGLSNLAYYDVYERGVLLKSPAFDNKVDYTVFWGREQPGILAPSLSPGSTKKTLDAFMSGVNVNVSPDEKQKYSVSVFHGSGNLRKETGLHEFGYDASAEYGIGPLLLNYETAFDSEKFAYLLTAGYEVPRFKLTTEARDSAKDFLSMTGSGYRAGEKGVLSTLDYTPWDALRNSVQLDIYQDGRFPNPEHPDYWNQDLRWNTVYAPDFKTSFSLDYTLQNDLGRLGAYRYQNGGIGMSRAFDYEKPVSMFANFSHQDNRNFSSSVLDYDNEKANVGLRMNLLGALTWYLSGEYNWLLEVESGKLTHPKALETGLEWSDRILTSPLYMDLLLTYRNEENAASPVSFLSGQDYIEGYAQLTWRHAPDQEVYFSSRLRNTWANQAGEGKGVEADLRAGIRYFWDTGFHWDPIGIVYGYVFRDQNEDGLMQRDEAPVADVRVSLGKDQSEVTDIFGYYCFPRVKGRKTHVDIDVASLPVGFVLTGPASQEVAITNGHTARFDFGLISRSEITGTIFEDTNGNGQIDLGELGIKGVAVTLENGAKAMTDTSGRYLFRKTAVGKHTITVDLKTLPTTYIPTVPIKKDIELFEGVSYVYNFPLKKIAQ